MNNKQGFTLIEFMIVITAMVLLGTAVLVTTYNVRVKARDARRVALVSQIQSVLETYYRDNGSYPTDVSFVVGQPLIAGSIEYFPEIPGNPQPWNDGDCPDEDFSYTQKNSGLSYEFTFCLGYPAGDLDKGPQIMTPVGIKSSN